MAKVYIVRHQAAGYLATQPFSEPPTDEQVEALRRQCHQSFGASHSKTPGEPYWMKVVEFDLLDKSSVIDVPERSLSLANEAGVGEFGVSGVGTVTNPPKKGA